MWAVLGRLRDEERLVELRRDRVASGRRRGLVSGLSHEMALPTVVREAHFDGAAVVRIEDETMTRWGGRPLATLERVLAETPVSAETARGVDLAGREAVFRSLAGRAPVLSPHRELDDDFDACVNVAARDGWVEARAVDEDGSTETAVAFEADRLTRVDFGGAFETALRRLASSTMRLDAAR